MLMDSGNSSSMQSNSSGGDHDQEYDSRSFMPPPPPPQPIFSTPDFVQPFSDFINWPNSVSDPNYATFLVSGAGGSTSSAAVPLPPPPAAPKNPKKRTRASRRAPTTVLTTDTSNFRAMVQEFTGIPAPPFGGAAAYSRILGGPMRQVGQTQRLMQSTSDMGGQTQLLGSAQQMGLMSDQSDPILHTLLLQHQHQLGYQNIADQRNNIYTNQD